MSKLVLNGDVSGSVTLDAPSAAGTTTLTLPTTSGTIVASDTSGNVGIGTTSPSYKLDVRGNIVGGNGTIQTAITWDTMGVIGTVSNHGLRLITNSAIAVTIDTSQNFQFNSGYGSVATAYGCRAWVNFDGTSNTANLTGTYSQSGTTVTVTVTNHGLIAGSVIFADATTGTAVDGTYTVATVTSANVFTYTAGTSLTTSGNMTLRRNTIRGSGNVSSITDNGTGDYTVNFTNAMPDANYSVSAILSNSQTVGNSVKILATNNTASPTTMTTAACRLVFVTTTTAEDYNTITAMFVR